MVLCIREAKCEDAERLALISLLAWQQSYKGLINQSYLDNFSFEKRLKSRNYFFSLPDPKACFVAEVEGEIVGFCDVGTIRKSVFECKGEIYAIYLLEDFKYQKIGTALWSAAVAYLKEQKLFPFLVQVLEGNIVARRFYEKKEGVLQGIYKFKLEEDTYKEVGYIFKDPMDAI